MFLLVRSLHIIFAFCYIGGLSGYIGMRLALVNSSSLEAVVLLQRIQHRFEKFMLRPGGALLVIFGLLTAWFEQWPHFALEAIGLLLLMIPFVVVLGPRAKKVDLALAEALQAGGLTGHLRAAMRDKVLFVSELATVTIVLLILFLMLVKPA